MEALRKAAALIGIAVLAGGASGGESEYKLKAAFLVEFTKYVTWPASAFQSPSSPIVIGVFGNDPFGAVLDQAAAGQRADGRSIQVRRVKTATEARECQVVFVPKDQVAKAAVLSAALKDNVLIVGESPGFAQRFGMINFYLDQRRIRFEANPAAAKASGLTISSRMLSLARIVGEKV